jgi:transposase
MQLTARDGPGRWARAPDSDCGDESSQSYQEPWCQCALSRRPAHAPARAAADRYYPSDTTNAEWALIGPLLPVPAWRAGRGGRPEAHCRRAVVDVIRYVTHNGCVWRALPADFPPWRTVYGIYQRWNATGATLALHDALRGQARGGRGPPGRADRRSDRFAIGARRGDCAQGHPGLG